MVQLMGTDEVSVNDPKYMEALRERMWQDYETALDKKEREREEAERARMRRLMKEGVVTYDDIKGDPLFQKEYKRTKLKYGCKTPTRRKQSPSRKPKRAQTAPANESGRYNGTVSTYNSPLDGKPSHHPPPGTTQKKPQERPRTVQWESRKERSRYKEEKKQDEDEENTTDYGRWGSYNKYDDPLILKMQDEETVDGLYSIAEELLDGKLPSQTARSEAKRKAKGK